MIKILPRGFLDQSTISLRHKPLPSTAGHLTGFNLEFRDNFCIIYPQAKKEAKKYHLFVKIVIVFGADNIPSHLSDNIIIDDAGLSAPHHPPLKHQVSLE